MHLAYQRSSAESASIYSWARTFGAFGNPALPIFGTTEWIASEADVRLASGVRAALCWLTEGTASAIALNAVRELERVDLEVGRRVREASWEISDAIDWRRHALRRQQLAAFRSRSPWCSKAAVA